MIAEYLQRHGKRKPLVILDTLGKVKRPKRSGDESFQVDYALGTQFKKLAETAPGSTILVVHHTRKAAAEDFIDTVSGTQGIAASVDYVMVLDRKRHSDQAILSVTGRDIIEAEYALRADEGILWRLDGDDLAEASRRAQERKDLMRIGERAGEVLRYVNGRVITTPADVARRYSMEPKRAAEQLKRLADAEMITWLARGEYGSNVLCNSAESAEKEKMSDDANGRSPGITALSAHTVLNTHTAHSVVSEYETSDSQQTCKDCGQRLLHPDSIARGQCEACRRKQQAG